MEVDRSPCNARGPRGLGGEGSIAPQATWLQRDSLVQYTGTVARATAGRQESLPKATLPPEAIEPHEHGRRDIHVSFDNDANECSAFHFWLTSGLEHRLITSSRFRWYVDIGALHRQHSLPTATMFLGGW